MEQVSHLLEAYNNENNIMRKRGRDYLTALAGYLWYQVKMELLHGCRSYSGFCSS